MILIDTSSWVEALRVSGRVEVRERVKRLLVDGLAAWCDMVAVELWNGARGNYEKEKLAELEREILCLPSTEAVWQMARNLAQECRKAGHTMPAADLVIGSCALSHGVGLEHSDEHFDILMALNVA